MIPTNGWKDGNFSPRFEESRKEDGLSKDGIEDPR
jgi:hypothetical protein